MKKFQAIISFTMDEQFLSLVPSHRSYISKLMDKGTIDSYAVSMESQTCWVTINAATKAEADAIIAKSPLYKYWTYHIEELFVYDSREYRLPALQLN